MSDRKLFKVDVEFEVYVLATDCFNALQIIKDNRRDIFGDNDYDTTATPIIDFNDIPKKWDNGILYVDEDYDGDDELNDLTCAEVFQATVEDMKDRELEAKLQVNIFSNDLKKAEVI